MKYVIFISLVLDLLGFTVILPLFPALLDYYSKHDSSGLYDTLLSGVSRFQSGLGVPERFNSAGVAASYAVWAVASSFTVFVLARVLGGLSKGNVSLSYSIMTDILDTSTRAGGM
ncbi:hypothetical protein HAZT_HAZT009541, partial [Hyalella azteca]